MLVIFVFLCALLSSAAGRAANEKLLDLAFLFDYTDSTGQVTTNPVTHQCETVHLAWSRSSATGPNPVAPYILQVYTSAFIVPFVIPAGSGLKFDWVVPFTPGTQYQICMFDSNGNSGGCQDTYTIIASADPIATPSCKNVTFPAGAMNVTGTVANGPLSQYGWIDQCTDISLLPNNGTPPYTLTIAPTLHPPYNITADSMTAINWTVELTWASSFFISVADSAGNSWANGPLHSGNSGHASSHCLDVDALTDTAASAAPSSSPVSVRVDHLRWLDIGISAGVGVAVGLLVGGVAVCYVLRRRHRAFDGCRSHDDSNLISKSASEKSAASAPADSLLSHVNVLNYQSTPRDISPPPQITRQWTRKLINSTRTGQYQIDPFTAESEQARLSSPSSLSSQEQPSPPPAPMQSSPPPAPIQPERSHVYVVHQDGGRAPVAVYTTGGDTVVELPPRYLPNRQSEYEHAVYTNIPDRAEAVGVAESSTGK